MSSILRPNSATITRFNTDGTTTTVATALACCIDAKPIAPVTSEGANFNPRSTHLAFFDGSLDIRPYDCVTDELGRTFVTVNVAEYTGFTQGQVQAELSLGQYPLHTFTLMRKATWTQSGQNRIPSGSYNTIMQHVPVYITPQQEQQYKTTNGVMLLGKFTGSCASGFDIRMGDVLKDEAATNIDGTPTEYMVEGSFDFGAAAPVPQLKLYLALKT